MGEHRRNRIIVACNSRGRMLDFCLKYQPIKERVWAILSDGNSGALEVAGRYGLRELIPAEGDDVTFSNNILALCEASDVDFIISTGFTRIFRGDLLEAYSGRIVNTHFSLLPAFPGRKGSDWTTERHPPKAIFERAMTYGARMIGNTVHLVDRSIDGGYPIMQSCLPVPYDEPHEDVRHRLFLHECQMFMQMVIWLSDDRLVVPTSGPPRIEGARFDSPSFAPAIEESWIAGFNVERAPSA
jgi:phosphoribosylglycinamide formyltransferase-1